MLNERCFQRETEVMRNNLVPVQLFPPQIPYGLSWYRIQASALRDRWLTVGKAWNSDKTTTILSSSWQLESEVLLTVKCRHSHSVIIYYQFYGWLWVTFLQLRAVKVVLMLFLSLPLDIPYGCFHGDFQTRIHYVFVSSSTRITCPEDCDIFALLIDIEL